MRTTPPKFWSDEIRLPYCVMAGMMGVLMIAGAIANLVLFLPSFDWLKLAWVPTFLFTAVGLLGLALTGRWFRLWRKKQEAH